MEGKSLHTAYSRDSFVRDLLLTDIAATIHQLLARAGCGPGFHRGYYGACRPNGPVVYPGLRLLSHPHQSSYARLWFRRWLSLASGIQALRSSLIAFIRSKIQPTRALNRNGLKDLKEATPTKGRSPSPFSGWADRGLGLRARVVEPGSEVTAIRYLSG